MAFTSSRDRAGATSAASRRHPAEQPHDISLPAARTGWRDALARMWRQFMRDRIMLIAAGGAFYMLLAVFPGLAVMVSVVGLVTDPHRIAWLLGMLQGVVPGTAIDIVNAQLASLASQTKATLTFSFAVSFLFALWSASNGIKTLFEAMNIAYEETEKRSFLRLNLLALVYTLGAILLALLAMLGVGVVPALLGLFGYSGFAQTLIAWLRWPLLFVTPAASIALLYRYGPSRHHPPRWRSVLWASVPVTALWLATAVVFSWYLSSFANYNATYGSLGAVIGFMMWTWVSLVVLIVGAELSAQLEYRKFEVAGDNGPSLVERGTSPSAVIARTGMVQVAAAVGVLAISWLAGRLSRQP